MNLEEIISSLKELSIDDLKTLSQEVVIAKRKIDINSQNISSKKDISLILGSVINYIAPNKQEEFNKTEGDLKDQIELLKTGSMLGSVAIKAKRIPLWMNFENELWSMTGGALSRSVGFDAAIKCFESGKLDVENNNRAKQILGINYRLSDSDGNIKSVSERMGELLKDCAKASQESFYGFSLEVKKGEKVWDLSYNGSNFTITPDCIEIKGTVTEWDDTGFTLRSRYGLEYNIPIDGEHEFRLKDIVHVRIDEKSLDVNILSHSKKKEIER